MTKATIPNDPLHLPAYSVAEAARIVGIHSSRALRWLRGYRYTWAVSGLPQAARQGPIVRGSSEEGASFLDLMELRFAKAFLDRGFSLQKIRRALKEAETLIHPDHPFARRAFYTTQNRILLDLDRTAGPTLVELLSGGQLLFRDMMKSAALHLDFDASSHLTNRYWPLGRHRHVVLDPTQCFGAPTLNSRSVRTRNLYDFWKAESESIEATADWFALPPAQVQDAIDFECQLAA